MPTWLAIYGAMVAGPQQGEAGWYFLPAENIAFIRAPGQADRQAAVIFFKSTTDMCIHIEQRWLDFAFEHAGTDLHHVTQSIRDAQERERNRLTVVRTMPE